MRPAPAAHRTPTQDQQWRVHAACRGDHEPFFALEHEREPERVTRERKALAICGECPVQPECLAYVMRAEEGSRFGVWGGTTTEQRAAMRRKARR